MAMYSAKEMKAKLTGKKVRELELKDGKQIKIWIPKNEFYYERKHFNIKMVDKFKNAQVKAVTCINSEAHVADCPVCDYIQELWSQWRETTDKEEKKKIQGIINRLSADTYYVNAVDIADKTFSCYSLRLTNAMFNTIMTVVCPDGEPEKEISHILWTIKKTVNNGNTKYTIIDDYGDDNKGNPTAMKLARNIAKICDRDENRGGYVDLDKAYAQNLTVDEYYKKLYGDSDDEVETPAKSVKRKEANITISDDELSLDEVEEEPVKKPVKKVSKKPVVEEDDDLELDEEPVKPVSKKKVEVDEDDDLDLDDEEPVKPVKKVSKKPVVEDDDDLELDEEPVKKPIKQKKVEIEDDDLNLDDLDEEPEPKQSKPVQKKKPVEVDDDDLDLDDMDEEPEQKPVKKAQPKKPVKQEVDDSDLDDLELDDVPF